MLCLSTSCFNAKAAAASLLAHWQTYYISFVKFVQTEIKVEKKTLHRTTCKCVEISAFIHQCGNDTMQLNTEWNKKEIKVVLCPKIKWEHDSVVMSVSLYKVLCHWEKTESTICAYHNKETLNPRTC